MSAREFKLFNKSETAYIAEQVGSTVRNWSNKWFNDLDLAVLEIICADELSPYLDMSHTDWSMGEFDSHVFALYCPDAFLDSLYTNIVTVADARDANLNANTYISRKLVNINIGSLVDDVCKLFYPKKNTIRSCHMAPEEFLVAANRYGSGYVFFKLSLKDSQFMVFAMELGSAPKLTTLKEFSANEEELYPAISAFGSHTVKLEALIGHSEIDIKSLTNMAIGDVLTIDTVEDSDIELRIDQKKVCAGKIGRKGNNFAVKISAYYTN